MTAGGYPPTPPADSDLSTHDRRPFHGDHRVAGRPRPASAPPSVNRRIARSIPSDVPRGTFVRGPSRTVRRADALAWLAGRLFETGDAPALAPDRHEIVVHVEADVLADCRAGRCEIEHGTAIAAETARRLCCDAGIVPSWMVRTGNRSVWDAELEASRPRCAARSRAGTADAASPAAPPPNACTVITYSTGPTAVRRRSTISFCSARPITGWFTRADSTCSASMTVHSGSPTRTDWPSDPHGGKRPRHRTRSSSRTRPSGSPSTARPQPRTGMGNALTTTMR